jgi:hypothetical protein
MKYGFTGLGIRGAVVRPANGIAQIKTGAAPVRGNDRTYPMLRPPGGFGVFRDQASSA